MVYYRKYRPQSLEELVGQDHVKDALDKAHKSGRLAHAYLFCGPKGSGKTSTARILAKMVNCEAENRAPCNKCSTCISITDGSNLDLIEIDAASNRGIDDIRELRDKIKLSPSGSNKKVYIIDEVHMLTTEAFNALLKTLEEPPEHVLFVLATTDPQKIPQTILSRVQRLNFRQGSQDELVTYLKSVVAKEKIKIDDLSLKLIAEKSEGSFRDGLKILDQLSSAKVPINPEVIEKTFKSGSFASQSKLIEFISQKNIPEGLKHVSVLVGDGVNLREYIISSLEILRTLVLIKYNAKEGEIKEELSSLAAKLEISELIKIINNFNQALERMKYVSILELPLEVAIVESCYSQEKAGINRLENASLEPIKTVFTSSASKSDDILKNPSRSEFISIKKTDSSDSSEILILKDKWAYILETVRPYNYSLEALLKQAKLISADGADIVLEVPYAFHQRILDAPKSRNLLESVLAEVLGKPVKVSTVIGSRPILVEELANVEVAADDEIIKIASEIFNS